MNRIECNDCGEIVETTATTVKFPYSCTSCISDNLDSYEADYDAYYDNESCDCGNCEECEGQKYEDMAPARSVIGCENDEMSMEEVLCPSSKANLLQAMASPADALIADLKAQNESLTREIEFADARARKYQIITKNEEALRVSAEARLENALKNQDAQLQATTAAALEQSQKEVLEYQEKVDSLVDEVDVMNAKWGIVMEAFRKAVDIR